MRLTEKLFGSSKFIKNKPRLTGNHHHNRKYFKHFSISVIKVTKLKFASTEVTYIKIKAVGIFSKTFQNEGI